MNIKRLYYTEGKKQLDEILREEDERLAKLTDEERKTEESCEDFNFSEIYQRYKKMQPIKILSKKRIEYFMTKIVKDALYLAETDVLDIEIETLNDCGIVLLSSDAFIFNSFAPHVLEMYKQLLVTADDIYISTGENDMVIIRFTYDFFDRIPRV